MWSILENGILYLLLCQFCNNGVNTGILFARSDATALCNIQYYKTSSAGIYKQSGKSLIINIFISMLIMVQRSCGMCPEALH